MSKIGFMESWVAGSRVYFIPDQDDESEGPTLDLGTLDSAQPQVTSEKIELKDADGGQKITIDEAIVDTNESYDMVLRSLHLDNLAFLFLAADPEEFTQADDIKAIAHKAYKGRLLSIRDDDEDRTLLYNLAAIAGIVKGASLDSAVISTGTLTEIVVSGSTVSLKVTGDITGDIAANENIIIAPDDVDNIANVRTVQAASDSHSGGVTTIVLTAGSSKGMVAQAATMTGKIYYKAASGNTGDIVPADEFDVRSGYLDRGLVAIKGGTVLDQATHDVVVVFKLNELDGKRLIKPQSLQGERKGLMKLVWSREKNGKQTVREVRVSISPNSTNITADDFSSLTLTAKVLKDPDATDTAGRALQFKGSLPDAV